jgi:hypothetical protein
MADTKISALPASTTPLAGTEVLPIVQSSTTKQVSVANLTAGRAISATSVTASTGNFVVGTSGQGIDFSATPGTGTSELFSDYEEGTWTPTDASGDGLSFSSTSNNCFYIKTGNIVTCVFNITYPTTASASAMRITGLPFASKSTSAAVYGGYFTYTNTGLGLTILNESASANFVAYNSATSSVVTNVTLSTKILRGIVIYQV